MEIGAKFEVAYIALSWVSESSLELMSIQTKHQTEDAGCPTTLLRLSTLNLS